MPAVSVISKTDLARKTRQVVDRVRRGQTIIVESYGEEQVAILDILDYHILRAVAAYRQQPPRPAPIRDETLAPAGLTPEAVSEAVRAASGDVQAAWDLVIVTYLDGNISLGRAAQLLDLTRYELTERLNRLGVPLHLGPSTVEEAQAEAETLARWTRSEA
ncbi:MAG: UPF0175 family protein [Anaerolineae bacterium]